MKGGEPIFFRYDIILLVWGFHYTLPYISRHHWPSSPAPFSWQGIDQHCEARKPLLFWPQQRQCHLKKCAVKRWAYIYLLFCAAAQFSYFTRCWTFSPATHWSSDAVPRAHEPVHHLQNISPTPILPTCLAMSTEPSQSKMTSTGTVGCDYRNILGLQLHNLFSPWMMIS